MQNVTLKITGVGTRFLRGRDRLVVKFRTDPKQEPSQELEIQYTFEVGGQLVVTSPEVLADRVAAAIGHEDPTIPGPELRDLARRLTPRIAKATHQ